MSLPPSLHPLQTGAGRRAKSSFPLQFAWWKLRMARNILKERREFVALSLLLGILGLGGGAAYVAFVANALRQALEQPDPAVLERSLNVVVFAAVVAFFFMALANVLSGFFSPARMEEREQLMGPLSAFSLFLTEVVDSLRLPFLLVLGGAIVPLGVVAVQTSMPLWLFGLLSVDLLALFSLPTLMVVGGYIALMRSIPSALLGRNFLLFLFFFVSASLAAAALGELRGAFQGGTGAPTLFPASLLAGLLPAWKSGRTLEIWTESALLLGVSAGILGLAWTSYRYLFLEQLERFGVLQGTEEGRGLSEDAWSWRLLRRFLSPAVAAVVVKDLRSARRDTAQRVAFTALAAVILALVMVDVTLGRMNANIFLPIFYLYATFLVACQGLSTFSAEGGVLENLAFMPLDAGALVKGKVVGHALLFWGVSLATAGVLMLAPSPVPLAFRIFASLSMALLAGPVGGVLSWVTVCLGAIFPKPGEGGGRKEISVFAMGLFLQWVTLVALALPISLVLPFLLGPIAIFVPVVVVPTCAASLWLMHILAVRAVDRALGAELRAG